MFLSTGSLLFFFSGVVRFPCWRCVVWSLSWLCVVPFGCPGLLLVVVGGSFGGLWLRFFVVWSVCFFSLFLLFSSFSFFFPRGWLVCFSFFLSLSFLSLLLLSSFPFFFASSFCRAPPV
ncbi:unnamed protein product [Polarella glacialis]|uniref:Uncharacterized protein n=1 Tax=Polarella glacialis TaxID=89957 RepID=A0A813EX68_POLGL|nr:unnamed protein product [Polarella glacialis]